MGNKEGIVQVQVNEAHARWHEQAEVIFFEFGPRVRFTASVNDALTLRDAINLIVAKLSDRDSSEAVAADKAWINGARFGYACGEVFDLKSLNDSINGRQRDLKEEAELSLLRGKIQK